MYHPLLEAYLTHYQPQLKADLLKEGVLEAYLEAQAETMQTARNRILAQLEEHYPQMSHNSAHWKPTGWYASCT